MIFSHMSCGKRGSTKIKLYFKSHFLLQRGLKHLWNGKGNIANEYLLD